MGDDGEPIVNLKSKDARFQKRMLEINALSLFERRILAGIVKNKSSGLIDGK
jgi:hypothetical protein